MRQCASRRQQGLRAFIETVTDWVQVERGGRPNWSTPSLSRTAQLDRIHKSRRPPCGFEDSSKQIGLGLSVSRRCLDRVNSDPPRRGCDQAGVPVRMKILILSTDPLRQGPGSKSVFVPQTFVDGCIPSGLGNGTSAAIEEERSLLYVDEEPRQGTILH